MDEVLSRAVEDLSELLAVFSGGGLQLRLTQRLDALLGLGEDAALRRLPATGLRLQPVDIAPQILASEVGRFRSAGAGR